MNFSQSNDDTPAWRICKTNVPKQEVIYICQLITCFTVVLAALINLSLTNGDKTFWATVLAGVLGYLVPNPSIRKHESIYNNSSKQQLHGLSPPELSI